MSYRLDLQNHSDEIMAMISNGGISTMVEPSLDNTRPSSNSIWTKSIVRTVPYATGVVGMAAVAKLHGKCHQLVQDINFIF